MKKILIIGYAVLDAILYFIDIYLYNFDMEDTSSIHTKTLLTVVITAGVVAALISIFCAIIASAGAILKEKSELFSYSRIVLIEKLVLIPFFLFNFGVWLLITMGLLVVPGLQLFLGITLIGIGWTYILVLGTSAGGLAVIVKLYISDKRKEHTVSSIICAIAQFIFATDVIAYIVFHFRNRKIMKKFQNNEELVMSSEQ